MRLSTIEILTFVSETFRPDEIRAIHRHDVDGQSHAEIADDLSECAECQGGRAADLALERALDERLMPRGSDLKPEACAPRDETHRCPCARRGSNPTMFRGAVGN